MADRASPEIDATRESVAGTTHATTGERVTPQPFRSARRSRIAELLTCRLILDVALEAPLLADPVTEARHA